MDTVGTGLLSIVGRLQSLSRRVLNVCYNRLWTSSCLFYEGCLLLRVSIIGGSAVSGRNLLSKLTSSVCRSVIVPR